MRIISAILMGIREIWANKLRSFLTLFCVLLGVASVVVTVGYMRGLTASWRESLKERGGVEKISVSRGRVSNEQEAISFLSPGLKISDAEAILRDCPHVRYATPVLEPSDGTLYRGRNRDRTDIEGVYPESAIIENFEVVSGRFITDIDNERLHQVAVIGQSVYERLFDPGDDPIGEYVYHGGLAFEVVGLLKSYELTMGSWNALHWKNDICFMPLATVQKKITGDDSITGIDVVVDDPKYVPQTVEAATNILRRLHRGIEDVRMRTNEEMAETLEKQERSQVATGAAVSLITIIIGGIGIMNLMLASINERVREIGIRKAIGARRRDLFFQFSVESVTLCVIGGVLGVMAGQGVIHLLQELIEEGNKPIYTTLGVVMGFSASVVIGILAGIYPAVKAARMDPIEALRHE
ncbi:ABC transporter permease [soil metagenome]